MLHVFQSTPHGTFPSASSLRRKRSSSLGEGSKRKMYSMATSVGGYPGLGNTVHEPVRVLVPPVEQAWRRQQAPAAQHQELFSTPVTRLSDTPYDRHPALKEPHGVVLPAQPPALVKTQCSEAATGRTRTSLILERTVFPDMCSLTYVPSRLESRAVGRFGLRCALHQTGRLCAAPAHPPHVRWEVLSTYTGGSCGQWR
jgi:hypothetical protein